MAQVIICNLPDEVVARLKARAAGRKRSLTPRRLQSDSTDLICEDRDRGWG
jgi:hypothetical protein